MDTFDVIVIGTGGAGSASLYHLARRGLRVLGLDQFPLGHSKGSSHGQTRIIRQAYFEHPNYVPLLQRAYELWRSLEAESGKSLFHQVGLVEVGPQDGVLIPGVMESVKRHQLEIEELHPETAARRIPMRFPSELKVVFEPTAGYLLVEDCVRAHADRATVHGASWKQEPVVGWTSTGSAVEVETTQGCYSASSLVICGGAWSADLLSGLNREVHSRAALQILEKHQYWFTAPSTANSMPAFFFETDYGEFYGMPQIDNSGIKVARHTSGKPHATPIDLATVEDHEDQLLVQRFAKEFLAFEVGEVSRHEACMYTMSPDGHFLIDLHPDHSNVAIATGLSGHGFKFTSVLGEVMSELATQGSSPLPIDFLRFK